MSVYPTRIKNFFRSEDIEASDGIVDVIDRPIVLKSFSLNFKPVPNDGTTNTASFTIKMFDGTEEILRVYDGANSSRPLGYAYTFSRFNFDFAINGIRIKNSLAFSIELSNESAEFAIESISINYQD